MDLLEQVFKLLRISSTFDLVNGAKVVIDIACVLGHTHICQGLQ